MRDPRDGLWRRLGLRQPSIPSHQSEAPEAGIVEPDVPGPGRALPLFAPNTPLATPPEHPGMLPPHYRVLDTEGAPYAPDVGERTPRAERVPGMPEGNELYDTFGTRRMGWRYLIEAEAHGSVTPPAANTSSTFSLSTFTPSPLSVRVNQQPTTGRAYIVVRRFSAYPRTLADTGVVRWSYVDLGGQVIPLATLPASAGITLDMAMLTPFPVMEPAPPTLGSIQLDTSTGSVVAAVWDWSLAFAFAYVRSGKLTKGDWP